MRKALTTQEEIEKFFQITLPPWPKHYPILLPLPFAEKIRLAGVNSALGQQFIPQVEELNPEGLEDPIGDLVHLKTPYLIHRYPNRALFLPTPRCPVICRYCFRKNQLPSKRYSEDMSSSFAYLQNHPEINEVIFSGGDPFILSDKKLEMIIREVSQIETIHYLRFHTRTPIILPSRFTKSLCQMIKKYQASFNQITIVIHTNHLQEIYPEVEDLLQKFKRYPFTLLSQTVLLKGVNNNLNALQQLFEKLISLGIRPYYLHHPDQVRGGTHFQLSLEEGRRLYHQLRSYLPGWAIPRYILDVPGGAGKIDAFNPESYHFGGKLLTLSGKTVNYCEKVD